VFPHPPAAGAAAGGRGNRRNRRRRGEQEGGFRNRLSALFTGRGWVQVPFLDGGGVKSTARLGRIPRKIWMLQRVDRVELS
jgi:hypothetical protein